jgi:hypothetical protein
MNWGHDPFGGSTQMSMPTSRISTYSDPKHYNRISSSRLLHGAPPSYDVSGNVTEDNLYQYLYDGDGRVCAVKNLIVGSMTGHLWFRRGR